MENKHATQMSGDMAEAAIDIAAGTATTAIASTSIGSAIARTTCGALAPTVTPGVTSISEFCLIGSAIRSLFDD